MSGHKFKIGHTVTFREPRRHSRECKIIRLLPLEGGSYLYRIKCFAENLERVAKESELASKSLDH